VSDGKTKSFVGELRGLAGGPKVLIVSQAFDEKTYLAGRNVGPALLMTADEVNVEQLLHYDKVVLTQSALPILARRTQK